MPASDEIKPPVKPIASRNGGMWWWGWMVLMVGFAMVRLPGLFNDLWLDEIWSLRMVQSISSPREIFTALRHDNNHPLNSLYLYWVQPAGADWVYRLLSWLTGSAMVGWGALLGRDFYRKWHEGEPMFHADVAGWLTGVLLGGAYLLVHYASEARGYAPAVAFGLLAWYALGKSEEEKWGRWAMLYSGAVVLGVLAHLTMVQVLLAGAGWSLWRFWVADGSWKRRFVRLLGIQLPSWLMVGVYYVGFVRKMEIGGGPENPWLGVLGETAAYTIGVPLTWGMVSLTTLLIGTLVGLLLIGKRDRPDAFFYMLVIFVMPVVGMLASRFTLLFPRYFLMSVAFALPVVGYALARWAIRGRVERWMVVGLLLLFLTGNGLHLAGLIQEGRGQYREALSELAARTPFDEVTISSDHDFRNYALVDYYQAAAEPGKKLIYYPADRLPPIGTQWRLLHRINDATAFPDSVSGPRGNFYVLEKVYPCVGLSGWTWAVYRNFRLEPKS